MADSKIDGLLALNRSDLDSGDWLLVFDTSTGITKKLSPNEVFDLFNITFAAGDVLYHDGTNIVNLAKGTDGEVLTLASGVPAWTPGGGLEFISSTELANDATAEFTGFDATKYDSYEFVLMNVIPATDAVDFYMRTSTNGGSLYDSGASDYSWGYIGIATAIGSGSDSTSSQIQLTDTAPIGSAAGEDGLSGSLKILGPHLAKGTQIIAHTSFYHWTAGAHQVNISHGIRLSATDVDAVQFLFSSGNLESGTITMYGMRNT